MRRATKQQEADTGRRADEDVDDDDDQSKSGYLESLSGKFTFERLPNKIEFCGCSTKTDQLDDVLRFIMHHA